MKPIWIMSRFFTRFRYGLKKQLCYVPKSTGWHHECVVLLFSMCPLKRLIDSIQISCNNKLLLIQIKQCHWARSTCLSSELQVQVTCSRLREAGGGRRSVTGPTRRNEQSSSHQHTPGGKTHVMQNLHFVMFGIMVGFVLSSPLWG